MDFEEKLNNVFVGYKAIMIPLEIFFTNTIEEGAICVDYDGTLASEHDFANIRPHTADFFEAINKLGDVFIVSMAPSTEKKELLKKYLNNKNIQEPTWTKMPDWKVIGNKYGEEIVLVDNNIGFSGALLKFEEGLGIKIDPIKYRWDHIVEIETFTTNHLDNKLIEAAKEVKMKMRALSNV